VKTVATLPGVAHDAEGPIAIGETVIVAAMSKLGTDGGISNVQVRGIPEGVLRLRKEVTFIAGRPPRSGTDEAAVGARVRGRFKGLELGESVELKKNRHCKVVGIFEDGGSSCESEVWVDFEFLRTAFGRENLVSAARVKLVSEGAFDAWKTEVEHDQRLGLQALRESTYYENQSRGLSIFVGILGVGIAVFFSVGAVIGAMITMYAAVASRQREIGTLRAIGFSRLSVLTSILLESLLIALLGGLIGAAASTAMGFVKFSMVNFASWSEIVFAFHPTPTILISSVVASLFMGLMGGFFPAVRAALLPPILAMRGE
jgi:putative ABC transport system permease protein